MKKIKYLVLFGMIICFVFIFTSLVFCNDNASLQQQIQLFKDYQEKYQNDKNWRKSNLNKLLHPGLNYLGLEQDYSSAIHKIKIVEGEYIFSELVINNITESKEKIVFSDRKASENLTDVYIVSVTYYLDQAIIDGKIIDYKNNIDGYWIFVKDSADGLYKVYDSIPSLKIRFIPKEK